MKFKSNEEGKCPICNSQMIEYFGMEIEDTAVYFPWHCPDCDTDGKEWYYVNFSEVRSNDDKIGNEEGICPDCGAEIEYGTAEPDGNSLGYEYFCPECENSGREWYDLDFDSHTVDGHEDEDIEMVNEALTKNYGGQNLEAQSSKVLSDFENLINKFNGATDKKVSKVEDEKYMWKNTREEGKSGEYISFEIDETGGLLVGGYEIKYKYVDIKDAISLDMKTVSEGKLVYKLDKEDNLSEPVQEGDDIDTFISKVNNKVTEGIDYRDDKLTVTTAEDPEDDRAYYGKNMTKRDKVRSLDQAKRNLDRMEKDPRVTQGQAVDQLSFDSALDTDFAYYKHNKDMAKIDKEQGNDFWADEHNKTAKQFADKIRAKHKKQEDNETLKLSDKMKEINIKKSDDDVDDSKVVDVKGKYGNMKSIKVDKDKLSVTPSIAKQINKKQEDIEDNGEENDNDLLDTISLLDMALSEIPTTGVEDWGKDDELLFTADTKVLFENLKSYEHKIPRSYYDNAENDDWSNGIDKYLEDKFNVDIENGESDNTYNWNAPLTHDVEFTVIQAGSKCFFKASIHRAGDVRGNYTTEFLLEFNDKDDCYEAIFDACSENCCNEVTLDGVNYVIEPHFFNEYVSIFDYTNDISYDEVYCCCIDELKELIAENKKDEEPVEESKDYVSANDKEYSARFKDWCDKILSEPRSEDYKKGLELKDDAVKAWKDGNIAEAFKIWSSISDLIYKEESDDRVDELRKTIEWTLITDTVESQFIYDMADYGKKQYGEA